MTSEEPPPPDPVCPLCHSSCSNPVDCEFENILKCEECQFIFADPRINWETSYEEDFADAALHPTFVRKEDGYVIRNRAKLSRLLRRMAPFQETNRLLDVGCSAAFFLKLAEEEGWTPYGVEISKFGAEFSQNELNLNVFQGTLEEAEFPDEHFDVVFSSHVLEHIAQPLDLLREMYRVLRPGGAVVSVVPTQFSSPSYRFFHHLHGDPPPRHVSFFDKKTFERLLKSSGFQLSFSQYNLELNRLRQLVSRSSTPSGPGQPKQPHTGSVGGYGTSIRMIKSALNPIATLCGLGDELLTVATKPATGN